MAYTERPFLLLCDNELVDIAWQLAIDLLADTVREKAGDDELLASADQFELRQVDFPRTWPRVLIRLGLPSKRQIDEELKAIQCVIAKLGRFSKPFQDLKESRKPLRRYHRSTLSRDHRAFSLLKVSACAFESRGCRRAAVAVHHPQLQELQSSVASSLPEVPPRIGPICVDNDVVFTPQNATRLLRACSTAAQSIRLVLEKPSIATWRGHSHSSTRVRGALDCLFAHGNALFERYQGRWQTYAQHLDWRSDVAAGMASCIDWIHEIRQVKAFLRCDELLPAPAGYVLTPTTEVRRVRRIWGHLRPESVKNLLRRKILFAGETTSPKQLISGVISEKHGYEALRALQKTGEYSGFLRAKRRKRSRRR